ncbi:PstS family phosphate ABC transporter substrate-binding protein [Nostoc sp. CHAB 5715]|uniref:PstS family phosphate ABC transporter substrate-binding protein n=1 Tax=Nostoc sp. CHAB 5715 TaxID=2780400 RepID=UPI001E4E464D|nr:substrate-binding domain-containing protein [Nostoc sp. CHAB 5715]MCC5620154.1 substrate-binding domain-containing protein [Nostoc sp. CHAB 5715]
MTSQISNVITQPYISYWGMHKSARVLDAVISFYFPIYNLSHKDFFTYYPVLGFVEALVYQTDEAVETNQKEESFSAVKNPWEQRQKLIIDLLKQRNLYHPLIEEELENLEEYKKAFLQTTKGKFPVSANTRADLKRFQQNLGLRDEDTALIENSQKKILNLAPQSIGMLSIGVIIGAAAAWLIKPAQESRLVISPPKREVINQFVEVPNVPEGTFTEGGSTYWAFIYPKLESEIKNAHRQFDIKIREDLVLGSRIGIEKLIDGGQDGLDFALSSRDVSSEDNFKAKTRGFTLKGISVVKSGLAVVVNPKLTINALTKKQLSEIFSGKIDNWRQAGAFADIPIKVYVRDDSSGTTEELKKILEIQNFSERNINYVKTLTIGLENIIAEPGGIFIGQISEVVPHCRVKTLSIINDNGRTIYPYQQQNFVSPAQCRAGNRNRVNIEAVYSDEYPLPIILYVVVKQNGRKEQQAGEAYGKLLLTKQGQEMIKSLQETGNFDENN